MKRNAPMRGDPAFCREVVALLRDYRNMTPGLRRRLSRLGFDVIESRRHVRLVFREEPSIVQIMPASGSDWRGGRNAATVLRRKLADLRTDDRR